VSSEYQREYLLRLPLPLAQLYRRPRNEKTPVDRHHNAYYLAEVTPKRSAFPRVGAALVAGMDHHSTLARSLEQLCLKSVGRWVGSLHESSETVALVDESEYSKSEWSVGLANSLSGTS
jgi:hypothetical protein